MKLERLLLVLFCAGALASAVTVFSQRWHLNARWRSASNQARSEWLQGACAPAIDKALRTVPETDTVLLVSGLDPALIPYYLYPRRIWQPNVDPETNALYMKLPPSKYPQRDVASFAVDWLLDLYPDNADRGGDLIRLAGRRK